MFAEQIAHAGTVWFAFLSCLLTLVLYLSLVPLSKNKGAKRLTFLLVTGVVLLGMTLARIYLGDWPGRYEVISTFFVLLGFAFCYLMYSIWSDQHEGARNYRITHPLHRKR